MFLFVIGVCIKSKKFMIKNEGILLNTRGQR